MLTLANNPQPITTAQGSFEVVCIVVQRDSSMIGQPIYFNPAFYCDRNTPNPSGIAHQGVYQLGQDIPLTNVSAPSNANHQAWIEPINNTAFKLYFSFFVIPNQGGYIPNVTIDNSTFLNPQSVNSNLGLFVEVGYQTDETLEAKIPINATAWCSVSPEVTYTNSQGHVCDGYESGEDLKVTFEVDGGSNNYYVGLLTSPTGSNSTGLVPALGIDYAQIGGTSVIPVDGLDPQCFTEGEGITQQRGKHQGCFTISGSCLINGSYRYYIVYRDTDGIWRSCNYLLSEGECETPCVYGDVTATFTDCFGNVVEADSVGGVSECTPIDVKVQMDVAQYDQRMADANIETTYADAFIEIKTDVNGIETADGCYEFTVQPNGQTGKISFDVTYCFLVEGELQEVVKVVDITFGVPITEQVAEVTDESGMIVGALCTEFSEVYTAGLPSNPDKVFSSVNGGSYVEGGVVNNDLQLNALGLTEGDQVCVKGVYEGEQPEEPTECECPPCNLSNFAVIFEPEPEVGLVIIDVTSVDGLDLVVTDSVSGQTLTGNASVIFALNNPTDFNITVVATDPVTGCTYNWSYQTNNFGFQPPYTTTVSSSVLLQECECPEEPDPSECENNIDLIIECDPETGNVTITPVDDINSPIDTDTFLCQIGTDLPIPCPLSISPLNGTAYITREITFTDGCAPISLTQVVECQANEFCLNSRSVTHDLTPVTGEELCTLDLGLSDQFDSPTLSDTLTVVVNGVVVFSGDAATYSNNIAVANGDEVTYSSQVLFDDGCNPIETTQTLTVNKEITGTEGCDYSAYSITCTPIVDPETGCTTFEVTLNGDQSLLEDSVVYYSVDGSNPMNVGSDGVYRGIPVRAEDTPFEINCDKAVVGWLVRKPFCVAEVIYQVCSSCSPAFAGGGTSAVTVNVECGCCDDDDEPNECAMNGVIDCVDCVYTFAPSEDTTGWTFTWCDQDGAEVGTGLTFDANDLIPEGTTGTFVLKANKEGCGIISISKSYYKPTSGTGGDFDVEIPTS